MKLREYQQKDAEFLASLPCSACFNEQRTGKTPTALETIKLRHLKDKRILIVTTASSLYQWKEEYEKWIQKDCQICLGTPIKKLKIIQKEWKYGLVVSLESFKETSNRSGLVKPILEMKPEMIILDEAHKIKNPKSANAKAIFRTTNIPYRLALTGTPAQGKPYDIYSILKFLFPSDFRGFWKFLEEYFIIEDQTIYRNGKPQHFKTYERYQNGKDKQLQENIAKFSTQRKRADVMPWLPEKFYERVRLEPTNDQSKYLKELQETYRTGEITTVGTLDRLVRYRQICLDLGLS